MDWRLEAPAEDMRLIDYIWADEELMEEFKNKILRPMIKADWQEEIEMGLTNNEAVEKVLINEYYEDWALDRIEERRKASYEE